MSSNRGVVYQGQGTARHAESGVTIAAAPRSLKTFERNKDSGESVCRRISASD
jgi:hypothetical protein